MPTLHWLTRDADLKLSGQAPYRLLEPVRSYGDPQSGNMLIQGDNLDALKALLPFYGGKVKCVCVDPPYNTQSAFAQYDDNLEHTRWLSMMYPRLELLRDLLSEDGTIWTCIDDNEGHYLKVIMDEVFGRRNFVASNVWQNRYSRENREAIGDSHNYILLYAKRPDTLKEVRNLLPVGEKQRRLYKNPDDDSRGAWQSVSLLAQGYRPNQMYEIVAPNGKHHKPPSGNCWKIIEPEYKKLLAENRVYFGKTGGGVPRRKEFLSTAKGLVPWTWWPHEECGHTDEAKKECNVLFGGYISFGTPKPERLIHRVLTIATNPGDLVLDSFLGSGTAAAVAHKMGRRWIGIEVGAHAETHCIPRLEKVVAGEQGGISEAVGWKGGGGFHFYRLGATVRDEAGLLNPRIRFAQLAAHVWFSATGQVLAQRAKSPLLGVHEGTAYYLLFNGILGDRRPDGGNVLTRRVLRELPTHRGPKIIYGESNLLGVEKLRAERIEFRQIPYDIKER